MLYQFLWSLAFVLALVLAGLMLRVVSFPAVSARPIAVKIRRSPVRGARPR